MVSHCATSRSMHWRSGFFALISIASILGVMTILFVSLVPEYGKEMLDKDVFTAEGNTKRPRCRRYRMGRIKRRLDPYGYNLLVANGDVVVFSDLEDTQTKAIESLKGLNLQENILTGKTSGVTFVAKPAGVYSIFAIDES